MRFFWMLVTQGGERVFPKAKNDLPEKMKWNIGPEFGRPCSAPKRAGGLHSASRHGG